MKLKIVLPEQKQREVEIESVTTIVTEVVSFCHGEGAPRWSLNPMGLDFANFADNFENVTLTRLYSKEEFQLIVSYKAKDEKKDTDFIDDVVLEVVSVEEVGDFPSISN